MNSHIVVSDGTTGWVTGENISGQLGIGLSDSTNNFEKLPQKFHVSQISCGHDHTLILETNGNVCGFGSNDKGKLGLDPESEFRTQKLLVSDKTICQIVCGVDYSMFPTNNG